MFSWNVIKCLQYFEVFCKVTGFAVVRYIKKIIVVGGSGIGRIFMPFTTLKIRGKEISLIIVFVKRHHNMIKISALHVGIINCLLRKLLKTKVNVFIPRFTSYFFWVSMYVLFDPL